MTIGDFTFWFPSCVRDFACLIHLKSNYFSLHPLLNSFHKRQKQHQFFLIIFHLIKHIQQTQSKFAISGIYRLAFAQSYHSIIPWKLPLRYCFTSSTSSCNFCRRTNFGGFLKVPSASGKTLIMVLGGIEKIFQIYWLFLQKHRDFWK